LEGPTPEPMSTPKPPSRNSSEGKKAAKGFSLETLGSDLYLPGEVTRQKLSFAGARAVLMISDDNPGADRLAEEATKRYPGLLTTRDLRTQRSSQRYSLRRSERTRSFKSYFNWLPTGSGRMPVPPASGDTNRNSSSGGEQVTASNRVFLLYLNNETWLGAEGIELAEQVRNLRKEGITVLLAHENDPTRGGCEFATFFRTTPEDLIADGLYARVAVAFHTGQHRTVSLCLLAQEILKETSQSGADKLLTGAGEATAGAATGVANGLRRRIRQRLSLKGSTPSRAPAVRPSREVVANSVEDDGDVEVLVEAEPSGKSDLAA